MSKAHASASTGCSDRIVRYADLVASTKAFIDTKTPGSDKKENFCLIGPGVAEDPNQHVHIRIPHGFNIGGARQPPGCKNSHHSHVSEEVFFVHEGDWKFSWGEDGSDGEAVLSAGDTISIPVNVFRGFENVGTGNGFLLAILGRDDPGFVSWAPYVFEAAKDHGLVLLEDGQLLDTSAGELIPPSAKVQDGPTTEQLEQFRRMSLNEMLECVLLESDIRYQSDTALCVNDGIREAAILGPANELENLPAGKMAWNHGFCARRLQLEPGAAISAHSRMEEEVIFVHKGELEITVDQDDCLLGLGDVITTPINSKRSFRNKTNEVCDLIIVRRGNQPQTPVW